MTPGDVKSPLKPFCVGQPEHGDLPARPSSAEKRKVDGNRKKRNKGRH